jgi:hypothetical protein
MYRPPQKHLLKAVIFFMYGMTVYLVIFLPKIL